MTTLIPDKKLVDEKILDEELKKKELEKYFNKSSNNFEDKAQSFFSNNLFYLCTIIFIGLIITIVWLGNTYRNNCRNLQTIINNMHKQGNQMLGMYGNLSNSLTGNRDNTSDRLITTASGQDQGLHQG